MTHSVCGVTLQACKAPKAEGSAAVGWHQAVPMFFNNIAIIGAVFLARAPQT